MKVRVTQNFNGLNFIILFLFSFFDFSHGQICYDRYDDALYLSNFDEYSLLADSIAELEIRNKTKDFRIYLLKAKLSLKKGSKNMAMSYLKEGIKLGCDLDHHIFTNRDFKTNLNSNDSLELLSTSFSPNFVEIPSKAIHPNVLIEFYELVHFDQALRYFSTKFSDSICVPEEKVITFENQITRKLLKNFLDRYGFPDENLFGSVLMDRFDKVIIHQKSEIKKAEWLIPYYEKAFKDKMISAQRFYNFEETFNVKYLGFQNSGAYEGRIKSTKGWEIFSVKNIEEIDNVRKNLCLSPLHVYLKNHKYQLPDGYNYNLTTYINTIRNYVRNNF
jgi:hypothetical protein